MKVIADLQLHSKYSRAVSQRMDTGEIFRWGRKKGMKLMATGDWTHPLWLRELKSSLEEDGSGFLHLKKEEQRKLNDLHGGEDFEPLYLLATEVSSIYTQGGKQRRIHTLIWAPSFATVDTIIAEFQKRGCNLASDGRPIVGLSSVEVAELVFSVDEKCLVIPAHAWTPWFSLYGSKSGFDSIEECFGKYAKYIYAVETGLSSDPMMNWRIPDLDNRAIVSFSDAHSGPKLGREATVFELTELTYRALRMVIMGPSERNISSAVDKIACTFEFYPEEGKYHFDGHVRCGVKQTPLETKNKGMSCHVCGRPLTVGVMYRVEELANREITPVQKMDEKGVRWMYHPQNKKPPYVNLVPLLEIIAESIRSPATSLKVLAQYDAMVDKLGSEFQILLKSPLDEIAKAGNPIIADAVRKVRAGDIVIDPGYDGEFGKVKIWGTESNSKTPLRSDSEVGTPLGVKEQMSLF